VTTSHSGYVNIEYSYSIPNELEYDSDGASWTTHCGRSTISSPDLPSFCSLEDSTDGTQTLLLCNAQTNLHVTSHTFDIIQTGHTTSTTTITYTVGVNCAALSWGVPADPASDFLVIPHGATFTPDQNMAEDSDGTNWNSECGTSEISY
jgi:hypothetical protein